MHKLELSTGSGQNGPTLYSWIDQSCSVLLLQLAKARESGELLQEKKLMFGNLDLSIKTGQNLFFSTARTDKFVNGKWRMICGHRWFVFPQHVPSLVVLLYIILCVFNVLPLILLTMVVSGVMIGWVYLRFYQPRGRGVKGDLSDSFSFASFFPEPIQWV